MLLSILIPTLEERRDSFRRLMEKLDRQIAGSSLAEQVEILCFLDDRRHSVGHKRNWLVEQARGEFVAFVDDDDGVSDEYVPMICRAILENPEIDCIGIKGRITFAGKSPRIFIHSIQYREYFSRGGIYYRPPYHLNPIRREIARRYRFADISYSEDIDWAMRVCRDKVLRNEYFIDEIIYFYASRRSWRYQRLLELSEPVRHALGLRLANRIRVRGWLKGILNRE